MDTAWFLAGSVPLAAGAATAALSRHEQRGLWAVSGALIALAVAVLHGGQVHPVQPNNSTEELTPWDIVIDQDTGAVIKPVG